MKIFVAQGSIQGARDYQQDACGQRDINNYKLLFLADGMGGYKGGEIASEIVINTFMRENFDPKIETGKEYLKKTLLKANKVIAEYKEEHPDVSSMGTTAVALLITESSYQLISVGDSLIYRIRNGEIERINQNHSVAGLLELQLKKKEITQEEVDKNPNKHLLTSAITGEEITMIDLSEENLIYPNDVFILASDGIETITPVDILRNVKGCDGDIQLAVDRILGEIGKKNKPNQDNATIQIVSFVAEESNKKLAYPKQSTNTYIEKEKTSQNNLNHYINLAKKGVILLGVALLFLFIGIKSDNIVKWWNGNNTSSPIGNTNVPKNSPTPYKISKKTNKEFIQIEKAIKNIGNQKFIDKANAIINKLQNCKLKECINKKLVEIKKIKDKANLFKIEQDRVNTLFNKSQDKNLKEKLTELNSSLNSDNYVIKDIKKSIDNIEKSFRKNQLAVRIENLEKKEVIKTSKYKGTFQDIKNSFNYFDENNKTQLEALTKKIDELEKDINCSAISLGDKDNAKQIRKDIEKKNYVEKEEF